MGLLQEILEDLDDVLLLNEYSIEDMRNDGECQVVVVGISPVALLQEFL